MPGFFPSVPTQISFELLYAPVDSRWRLFGISVKLGSYSPVAPSPPQIGPPPPPAAKPPVSASASAKKKSEAKGHHKKKDTSEDEPGGP